MSRCEYCQEDFDGYYKPLDKQCHVCIFDRGQSGYMRIDWKGYSRSFDIKYCPICGRKFGDK